MAKWNPARYAQYAVERLRPASDLLARVPKLTASQPLICDVGCGDGGPAKLLLQRFPKARLLCIDSSPEMLAAAQADEALTGRSYVRFACEDVETHFAKGAVPSGELYDLVYTNSSLHWCADVPDVLQRLLSRLRPGGTLAMQIPDTRHQPSHTLLREAALEAGLSEATVAQMPSNQCEPQQYADALLGPLCADLDMWSTTYVQRLAPLATAAEDGASPSSSLTTPRPPTHPVFEYVRATGARPVLAALKQHGGAEAVRHFEDAYCRRLASAYPATRDGSTLFPLCRFFLVARRPSLLDVYSEYAAYHDHQWVAPPCIRPPCAHHTSCTRRVYPPQTPRCRTLPPPCVTPPPPL